MLSKMRHIRPSSHILGISGSLLIVLGIGVAIGHYLQAPWDAPLQQTLQAIATFTDLASPTIRLALLVVVLSLLCLATFFRSYHAAPVSVTQLAATPMPTLPANAASRGTGRGLTTGLFYDFENESISPHNVVKFDAFMRQHAEVDFATLMVYADATLIDQRVIAALEEHDFHFTDVPHLQQKNVVDRKLIWDVLRFITTESQVKLVIFITQDLDYEPLVRLLNFLGFAVEVWLHNADAGHGKIKSRFESAGATVRTFQKALQ
jgi:hypothetical protein